MFLIDYIHCLTKQEKSKFAKACKTTTAYLQEVGYGYRKPKINLVIAIEKNSSGKVTCESLLPDVDFEYLKSR